MSKTSSDSRNLMAHQLLQKEIQCWIHPKVQLQTSKNREGNHSQSSQSSLSIKQRMLLLKQDHQEFVTPEEACQQPGAVSHKLPSSTSLSSSFAAVPAARWFITLSTRSCIQSFPKISVKTLYRAHKDI